MTNKNMHGTLMEIVEYENSNHIIVKFHDSHGCLVQTSYSNFKRRQVKNPYDITVFGVGYIGDGPYRAKINNKIPDEYNSWISMMRRCYAENGKYKFPAYYGRCTVCDEWHNYQNYASWYDENRYEVAERLHLDKDILYFENTVYAPDRCLLVPQRINMLFTRGKSAGKELQQGIKKVYSGGVLKYESYYNVKLLGRFLTLDEAIEKYNRAKGEHIIDVIKQYKDIMPKTTFDAIICCANMFITNTVKQNQ